MVVREASVANTRMLCLAVGAAVLTTACATSRAAARFQRPEPFPASNIRVAFPLEPCVKTMLTRSSTFHQTYLTIANHRGVRVSVSLVPVRRFRVRATTKVHSYVGGQRVAEIRLHTTTDLVELIAHEMEHVRELLEGTNLLLSSVAHVTQVQRVGTSFETRRGIETGLRVAEEVGSVAGRMCQASLQNAALMSFSF
jgi:hypothetical protein